ncbi:MAG: hypothetical protein ACXIUZ_07120 [Lysobacteraceae bacterium]
MSTWMLSGLLFLLAPATLAESVPAECVPVRGSEEPVCMVSHLRVLVDPARFDGRLVRLSGVFRPLDEASFQIYLSREYAEQLQQIDAIRVVVPEGVSLDRQPDDLEWIRVEGRFRVGQGPHPRTFLGAIELRQGSVLPPPLDRLPGSHADP